MSIKRYASKYKVLAKLKHALWLEKRKKINQFSRQKWAEIKKLYYPRKAKVFYQDCSTYPVGYDYESDRTVRLKKTYKQLLLDKQAFQLYYGARRLRNYQLKRIGLYAIKLGKKKRISPAKVFFHLMENRLEMAIYRTGLVITLGQARKLQATGRIKVNRSLVKNLGYNLKHNDIVKIEGFKSFDILARYLKFNTPFFYFHGRGTRKHGLFIRKEYLKYPFLDVSRLPFFFATGGYLKQLESLQVNLNGSSFPVAKTFIKNIDINTLLARVTRSSWQSKQTSLLTIFPNNQVKVCVYQFLKIFKTFKWKRNCCRLLGWKLQLNGLYTSLVEIEKKRVLGILRVKIGLSKGNPLIVYSFQYPPLSLRALKKRKNFSSLIKGLTKLDKLSNNYSSKSANRQVFFETLKKRRFFSSLLISRIFLYAAKGKKKYRTTFYVVFSRRRKINSLFRVSTKSFLKFKKKKKTS